MKKKLATLFAAAFVAVATNAVAAVPNAPITLPAKTGAVTFKHDTHKAMKCTQCHADEKGGKIEGLANKDKAHATCHECHKKEAKGPQKCGDCHKKG